MKGVAEAVRLVIPVAHLLVEQNAHQALRVADRAYVMELGRVVLSGAAAELREHELLRRTYLGARAASG